MHLVCTLPLECLYVGIPPYHLAFTLVCSFVPSFLCVFQLSELFLESCFHIIFAREVFLCWKVDGAPPFSHLCSVSVSFLRPRKTKSQYWSQECKPSHADHCSEAYLLSYTILSLLSTLYKGKKLLLLYVGGVDGLIGNINNLALK